MKKSKQGKTLQSKTVQSKTLLQKFFKRINTGAGGLFEEFLRVILGAIFLLIAYYFDKIPEKYMIIVYLIGLGGILFFGKRLYRFLYKK